MPAQLSADSMTYDRELGLITARGNVQVSYGDRILITDQLTYNQKTDVVLAIGNASLTDASGKILLGDRMEITGDLKDGVVHNIGLVLADRARIAGAGARRSNARITEVRNGVYSPCAPCEDDPDAPPLWQLKAVRVIHDKDDQRVEYRDAWLELYGYPVAYTPFLSHPDPTVKRRSGLLFPTFSNSSDLGFRSQTPYFWAIDEYQDATLTPLVTTDGGSGLIAQYRNRLSDGEINADGSFVTNDPDHDFRGYIDLETKYHIDDTWRAGLDIEATTDDTYTRRYGFPTDSSVLTSRLYAEGFRGNNYQNVSLYSFDDLSADSADENTPYILPVYDFNYHGKRDRLGGYSSFDFNALNLQRNNGTDTRRLSFRPRWDRPFSGNYGELYNASISLAADGYHSSGVILDDGSTYTGFAGRLVPRGEISWRLPLIRPGEKFNQIVEPKASIVVAPNGGNPDKIPNEDSEEIEFDETNLFRGNRHDGIDRVDGGTRFNYGLNWLLSGHKSGSTSVFLGQSYRPRIDDQYSEGSGLEDHFSDIVGRIQIKPSDYVDVLYRMQMSPDNFDPQRNYVTANLGTQPLKFNMTYVFIDQQADSEFSGREELSGSIISQVNKHWSASVNARRDLAQAEMRSVGLQAVYEDECVKFTTRIDRSFFEDRDLRPSDSITFTLVLKTLGEVNTGVSQFQ